MGQFGFDDISAADRGSPGLGHTHHLRRDRRSAVLPVPFPSPGWTCTPKPVHPLPVGQLPREWYLEKAIYRLELDGEAHALPLTSPYGPGTVWVNAEAALEDWAGFTARLSGELVFRNPQANLFTTIYESDAAIAGAALEGTLAVKGELRYRWKWLEAYAKPAFFYRASGGWLELALGATADLDWRRAVGKAARAAQ